MNSNTSSHRYALIVGNGRSGTNWLLTMINASAITHCRNEPQHIKHSPIHNFPDPQAIATDTPEMEQRWTEFAEWTSTHVGERDVHVKVEKDYMHSLSHTLGVTNWPMRPKVRHALGYVFPRFRQEEWTLPWWVGSQNQLTEAYSVFKLNDLPAWTVYWLLKHHPEIPILHIVRHLGGQLNSGRKRFFSNLSSDDLLQEANLYKSLLSTAVQIDSKWSAIIPEITTMSLVEALAWFWRYNNEAIYEAGHEQGNYHRVVYEDLARTPLKVAKDVYRFCDIPWTDRVEETISQGTATSVWGKLSSDSKSVANAWQNKLSPEEETVVNQVLRTSAMQAWWDTEATVL